MRHHDHHRHAGATGNGGEAFPTETKGLAPATSPETVNLRDGDVFDLRIYPVRKGIGGTEVRKQGRSESNPSYPQLFPKQPYSRVT